MKPSMPEWSYQAPVVKVIEKIANKTKNEYEVTTTKTPEKEIGDVTSITDPAFAFPFTIDPRK